MMGMHMQSVRHTKLSADALMVLRFQCTLCLCSVLTVCAWTCWQAARDHDEHTHSARFKAVMAKHQERIQVIRNVPAG